MEILATIIPSLISAGATLVVCLITSKAQHEKTMALIEYKIDELTNRVDKHNNVIERTYELERISSLHEEKIKNLEKEVQL